MELRLNSYHKDLFPVCGFFIENPLLSEWLIALHTLGLEPREIEIYGLPSRIANQLWGCLVLTDTSKLDNLGKYQSAQLMRDQLIIPEKSKITPDLIQDDFDYLFKSDKYVLHPDFGLYKLTEPIQLEDHLAAEELETLDTIRPKDHSVLTGEIRSFSIEATPIEDLKHDLESQSREKFEDKPLSIAEKLRLSLYKKLLVTEKGADGKISLSKNASALEKIAKKLNLSGPDINEKILDDFNNLEERNKKEVDKLVDLLKNDPEEALRYAIPLDEHGYSRGKKGSEFKMQDRGFDFSWFSKLFSGKNFGGGGRGSGGGGGSISLGDEYYKLRTQYIEAAKKLKEKGEYEKAAFIYLKLLKDYNSAAATLREGKKYEKAATVYLEYVKNEQLAAACYEEGKIYDEAIKLYKKLGNHEKTGDLYKLLGSRISANKAYQVQINLDLEKNKYIKAAKISKDKMENLPYTQEILLSGWNNKIDQYNCIRGYLDNIANAEEVWSEIARINRDDIDSSNDTIFLKVLKDEHSKSDENEEKIMDLAYELISKLLESRRISSNELLAFNKGDARLRADTLRYDLGKRKRITSNMKGKKL